MERKKKVQSADEVKKDVEAEPSVQEELDAAPNALPEEQEEALVEEPVAEVPPEVIPMPVVDDVDPLDIVHTYKKLTPGIFRNRNMVCRRGATIQCTRRQLGAFVADFQQMDLGKQEARLPNNKGDKAAPKATNNSTATVGKDGAIQTRKKHMYEVVLVERGAYNVVNRKTGKALNVAPLSKKEATELFNGMEE